MSAGAGPVVGPVVDELAGQAGAAAVLG
ncbi:MAG: hypothetical protein AVDCRST_MAG35-436, partial [uncultured Quadrisphaera sp.]